VPSGVVRIRSQGKELFVINVLSAPQQLENLDHIPRSLLFFGVVNQFPHPLFITELS